ncbi:MAG: nicotinate-nucleotide adenylyltransferase [Betaproteobacteria bacterium]
MTGLPPLVLFGGTFDPVHYGHLRVAAELATALDVPEVRLVPAADPPHRPPPGASAADRVAMIEIAIAGCDRVGIDLCEIERGGKSYTVDTLRALRRAAPSRALAWVVGADAFLGLTGWHHYRELPRLAHLVVVQRPGLDLAANLRGELASWWDVRATADHRALERAPAGSIVTVATTPHAISATAIRATLAAVPLDRAALEGLLPRAVLSYIESHQLYGVATDAC